MTPTITFSCRNERSLIWWSARSSFAPLENWSLIVIIWLWYLCMSTPIYHHQVKSILTECPSKTSSTLANRCAKSGVTLWQLPAQQLQLPWYSKIRTPFFCARCGLLLFTWIMAPILWNMGHKSLLGCWHLWFLDVSLHQAGSEFKFPVRNRWKRQFNRVRLNLSILIYKFIRCRVNLP